MLTLTRPLTPKEQATALAVDAHLRKLAPKVRPAHVATWHEGAVVVQDRRRPWLLVPLEADPLRTRPGGYPLPADARKELATIAETGVTFERIAIAHELAESEETARLLESLKAKGAALTHKDAAALVGKVPVPPDLQSKVRAVDEVMKKGLTVVADTAKMAGSAAAMVLAAPLVMVDPIVFGVVGLDRPPAEGRPALYYPLAAWEW